eukprot:459593_1
MWFQPSFLFSIILGLILRLQPNIASISGTWHINNKGYPMQTGTTLSRSILVIKQSDEPHNTCDGLSAEFISIQGTQSTVEITQCSITQSFYINNTILFNFCVDKTSCFEGKILEGIMTGHTCTKSINQQNCSSNNANSLLPFSGWNQLYFDTIFPLRGKYNASRDFLLTIYPLNKYINNNLTSYSHIRIDYNETSNQYIGRYKIFQQIHGNKHDEQLEYDLKITKWDGINIQFMLYPYPANQSIYQTFTGNIQFITLQDGSKIISRNINGTYKDSRYPKQQAIFTGVRWNILSPGLLYDTNRTNFILWQNTTRMLLKFLMMFGDPQPVSIEQNITKTSVSNSCLGIHRDDNCNAHVQNYEIYNVTLDFTIPNWYDNNRQYIRKVHGFMSFPFNYKNVSQFILSVNGHSGSSYQMMFTPNDTHDWYGDAFARRNYIELSIDISHRNTTPMYHDIYNNGDDPQHDNGPHPAIRYYDQNDMIFSDFEEDGERVWDAYHSAKWLMSTDTKNIFDINVADIIDKNRVYVSGLSMGGEITTFVGGLFANDIFCGVIPAGFSPDLDVMWYHGNHPCWRWTNANIREHMDTATLHGLIVPNLLVVLTGQGDSTYSNHNPPYSGDKQVLRRSRSYMSNNNVYKPFNLNVFHYLHYDVHRWHAGDIDDDQMNDTHLYVQIPNNIEPTHQNMYNDMVWQNVANTSSVECPNNSSYFNVFELLQYYSSNK